MCGCLWVHSLSLFGQAVFLVGFGLASEDLGWVLALFMVVAATELGEWVTAVGLLRDSPNKDIKVLCLGGTIDQCERIRDLNADRLI